MVSYLMTTVTDINKLSFPVVGYEYENGYQDIPRRVLLAFLRLRAKDSDLDLADMLEEVYEK